MRAILAAFLATPLLFACAADGDGSVCDQAEQLAVDCGEAEAGIEFGACTGEVKQAAEAIVAGGCQGLTDNKADLFSQVCQGILRDLFPWCQAEDYRCEPEPADLDSARCNGSVALCDRPYNETVFATSHNAYSAATMGFNRPNQSKRMYVQLRDGMRALMIDSRRGEGGQLSMCHVNCLLGEVGFVDGLREVRDFLECYPNEVVTLIIEPHAPGSEHVRAIRDADLERFVYEHDAGAGWPTLGEMIERDTRLVILSEQPGDSTPGWYHHLWDFGFDNEYSVKRVEDFACDVKRGQPDNDLFGLNHFITLLGGDESLSVKPNRAASLRSHVDQCETTFGRLPSYIAVDFHDIGDVVEVVEELNER